ncbi:YjfB family protein [Paenibacillus rhizoplanae]
MDIAALSVVMSQSSLQQAAGLQVMSLAKEQAQSSAQDMVQMLSQATHPTLGKKTLDIRA